MNVCFVLPRVWGPGIGGYAIVFEYAARLHDRGHRTTVLHLDPPPREPRALVDYLRRRWRSRHEPHPYASRPGMPVKMVTGLRRRAVAKADALVATGWETAEPVHRASSRALKAYLIQHYEIWGGPKAEVDHTWRLPLRRIVIASWLRDVAAELGALPVTHVPNAIDGDVFGVVTPAERRDPLRVGMLFSTTTWKRSQDGVAAVSAVRARGHDVRLALFSAGERPDELPDWVEWHYRLTPAEVAAFMDTVSVFLSPSEAEGWPLPPAEAMACGCALVSSAIGGVQDYAHEGETARLFPVGDVDRLTDILDELIADTEQRCRLARAGQRLISSEFPWDRSVSLMEEALRPTPTPEPR